MKRIMMVFAVAALMGSCAPRSQQSVLVDSDKKLNTDFSQYKTYAWSSEVDNKLDPGGYFLNDLILKDRIRKAVAYEMESRGYDRGTRSPDMIVGFRVFDKPTTIKGFTGYTNLGTQEVRQPEDTTSFNVEKGTILVSFVDAKTGQNIWRGFASGLMDGEVFNNNEAKIKEAVHMVFEEYPYRGDKYKAK